VEGGAVITTPVVTLGLALLTLVALVAILGIVLVAALGLFSWRTAAVRRRLESEAAASGVRLAWLVALVAMSGSLYFSQVAHFEPCLLCWYQRIAMYPLVAVLGVAAVRNDRDVVRYALPLALIGLPISLYHYVIESFPALAGAACDPRNPCTLVWFREFGFITLPFMALTAFALIASLLVLAARGERAEAVDDHGPVLAVGCDDRFEVAT
jgi:disulfide bond formation protein DsbB